LWFLFLAVAATAHAQLPGPAVPVQPGGTPPRPASAAAANVVDAGHRIGVGDELTITVFQASEMNTVTRVSEGGLVSLPLVGQIKAGGLSALEFEQRLEEQLGAKYIKDPDVTVRVTDVRSRAVTVVGAVQRPGVQQIPESARLLDVLSAAGGLTEEAGESVLIWRQGSDGPTAPVEVALKPLMESRDGALNVKVSPGDYVNVVLADLVFIVGAVKKPGAYRTRGNDRLTVLRALALGEGLAPAAGTRAVVVRGDLAGTHTEIPVDLAALLKGKSPDVTLQAQDVLFVPISGGKVAAKVALESIVRILSFRPF
jgi:polysaccharide export outer membrane protein